MKVEHIVKCNICNSYVTNGKCKCQNIGVKMYFNIIKIYCDNDEFEVFRIYKDKSGNIKKQIKIFDKIFKKINSFLDKI